MTKPTDAQPYQLPADKRVHVIHDGLPAAARGLEARKMFWVHALGDTVTYSSTALRARDWLGAEGSRAVKDGKLPTSEDPYPSHWDAVHTARGLRQMAVVSFMTIWTTGWAGPDAVSNLSSEAEALRQRCICRAFPIVDERQAFEELLGRLAFARDKLVAHHDACAQAVEHGDRVMSFAPITDIEWADVESLLECARRLRAAIIEEKAT